MPLVELPDIIQTGVSLSGGLTRCSLVSAHRVLPKAPENHCFERYRHERPTVVPAYRLLDPIGCSNAGMLLERRYIARTQVCQKAIDEVEVFVIGAIHRLSSLLYKPIASRACFSRMFYRSRTAWIAFRNGRTDLIRSPTKGYASCPPSNDIRIEIPRLPRGFFAVNKEPFERSHLINARHGGHLAAAGELISPYVEPRLSHSW